MYLPYVYIVEKSHYGNCYPETDYVRNNGFSIVLYVNPG